MTMDQTLERISQIVQQLPSTTLTKGEYNDRPAIYAGDEPIFLVRTTGETGQLFADALVEILPLLGELAGVQRIETKPVIQKSGVSAETEAQVRGAIASAVALQPEMKAKSELFSKLLFSAIAPYLAGAAPDVES